MSALCFISKEEKEEEIRGFRMKRMYFIDIDDFRNSTSLFNYHAEFLFLKESPESPVLKQ